MGHIVIYKAPPRYGEGLTFPAIIQHVDAYTVDLFVFSSGGFEMYGVAQGDAEGQWNWPPRV